MTPLGTGEGQPVADLVIRMLGTFEVVRGGERLPETAWHTQQAKQVLKALVLARGRPVPSDRLIEWLWPGANPASTGTTLRSTVHALRRALEPDRPSRVPSRYVVTRAPGYAFEPGPDTWVDIYVFEDLLDRASQTRHPGQRLRLLREALDLYRGDLLEEDPYAEWVIAERERLRERYLDALLDLAELHAAAGEYTRAVAACRRALARDEYREAAYRALMRYQVLAGDVAAALTTYERCRTMLKEEFGAEPAPQTQALYEAILRGEIPMPRQRAAHVPLLAPSPSSHVRLFPSYERPFGDILVGREEEHRRLREYLERLRRGRGGIVAVTGEMGIGKTHLVLHALQEGAPFPDVIGGRCLLMEQALPFAPLTNALRRFLESLPPERLNALPPAALAQVSQLVPSIHYMIPDLPPVLDTTPEENRSRLLDGLANLLIALSDQVPLVIFLDDVQWADEGTIALLGRLAYRVVRHPLLLILTYLPDGPAQNEDLRALLGQLLHDGLLVEIPLNPLARDDVVHFLARVWQRPESEVRELAEEVFDHTEGVPLFLVELTREMSARGDALPRPEDIPPVQSLSLVRTLILNRVEHLSASARDVLHLAAVIGRVFPLEVLETAAPFDPLPGLEELLHARFLQEEVEGRLAFAHDVVRQVVYGALPILARRRLHRQVADALVALYGAEAGPHAVAAAYHYRHAGPRQAFAALQYAVLAGDHLRRSYGFRQACEHYRQALRLAHDVLHDDRAQEWMRRAYLGLGLAYEAQGDWEGIVTTYTGMRAWAGEQGDRDLSTLAARRLATAMTVIGRLDEAAVMAGEMLAGAGEHPALMEIFRRLQVVFGSPQGQGDPLSGWPPYHPPPPVEGRPWEEVVEIIGREMAPLPLTLYGWSLALQGLLPAAEACLHFTSALAEAAAQRPYAVLAHHFLAHVAFMRDDVSALQEHLDTGFRLARQVPEAEWSTLWGRVFEGYIHLHLGDVAAARQRFAALDKALSGQTAFRSHHLSAWTGLALVAIAHKDLEEAAARLDRVLAERENLDVVTAFWAYVADAAIARRQGRWAVAEARAREALDFAGRRGLIFEYVAAIEEATRLQVALGEAREVMPAIRAALDLVREARIPAVERVAQRIRSRLRGAGVMVDNEG